MPRTQAVTPHAFRGAACDAQQERGAPLLSKDPFCRREPAEPDAPAERDASAE